MSLKNFRRSRKLRNRFDLYDPTADLTNPKLIGMINNDNDLELGLPSLDRKENVQLKGSNSTGEAISISLKWRPIGKGHVSLTSEIQLEIGDKIYQHEQTVIYKPSLSTIKPERITQYGSSLSNLKFYIAAPYRRMRVLFYGQMFKKNTSDQSFVRFNFTVIPTARIFDLLTEYNPKCLQLQCSRKDIANVKDKLVTQDRHEQLVRIAGEFFVQDEGKKKVFAWGYYSRQFLDNKSQEVKTKRIFAHFNNGRAFHVGQSSLGEQKADFGYTCFEILPVIMPIEKPTVINWDQLCENSSEFDLQVNGEGKSFECKGVRRSDLSNFFKIELDGKVGWATIAFNDAIDDVKVSEEELNKISEEEPKQSSERCLLISVSNSEEARSDLVGAKAASLAQLIELGDSHYKVPDAFVLTKFAYELILESYPFLKDSIERFQARFAEEDQKQFAEEECLALMKIIEVTRLPDELLNELKQRFELKQDANVAVRSSSWGEDEEGMSAAGQLTTLLNQRGIDEVASAIMKCYASKFSHANIEYKRQHGLPLNLPMAVVIQDMVACEKAGVMFTCDPTNGDDSIITITANYGLGESVVSGQSEPDSIRVKVKPPNELSIENITVGSKKIILGLEGDQDRSKCCLSEEEILRLAKCGRELVDYFKNHRDIEWGFKGDQMYLFQSRPITGLEVYSDFELTHECEQPSRGEVEFSTRANIGEVMPYAIRPLTLTMTVYAWGTIAHRWLSKISPVKIDFCPEAATGLLYDSYHSFFRLRCSQLFRSGEKGDKKSVMAKAMDISFFGREIGEQPDLIEASKGLEPPPEPFEGFRFEVQTTPLRLRPLPTIMKEKKTMRNLRAKVQQLKLADGYNENKMLGLYKQIQNIFDFVYNSWFNHITILLMSTKANMGMYAILSKYVKDAQQLVSISNKILAIGHDVISAQIPHKIGDMAQVIKSKGQKELDRFLSLSDEEAINYIEADTELKGRWSDFMSKFGHRCYNEFEIGEKSWRENKGTIVEMLRTNCKTNQQQSKRNEKAETIEEVLKSCDFNMALKDKLIMKYMLGPRCLTLVAARERTKDILVEYHDIMREASRMLATELRRNLRIPDEDLLYYFFYDELEAIVSQPQPALVMHALRRRNLFNTQFKELWKFDEVISGHHIIPNHMKPTKELEAKVANAERLKGTPASSGCVQAKVCYIKDYTQVNNVREGEILLTHSTDIAFSAVFPKVVGVITEVGGLISHGAVVAREYGLPSVLGIPEVTRILQDGEEIILDADNGEIVRLSKTSK